MNLLNLISILIVTVPSVNSIDQSISGCYYPPNVIISLNGNVLAVDMSYHNTANLYGTYDSNSNTGTITFSDGVVYHLKFDAINEFLLWSRSGNWEDQIHWTKTDTETCESLMSIAVVEPICEDLDTYSRSTTALTCSSDQDSVAGLCYSKCKSGYESYFGPDCIESDCPSGYTKIGILCQGTKYVKTCGEQCKDLPWPLDDLICNTVCKDLPYPVYYDLDIYARLPSWPDQCPTDYKALDIGSISALCYKSCEYGYIDAGVACVCDPTVFFDVIKEVADKFLIDFNDLLMELLDILNPLKNIESMSIDVMSPYLPFIRKFMSVVANSVVNSNPNNSIRRLLSGESGKPKGTVLVLEIAVSGNLAIGGSFNVGFVFDNYNDKYYWYLGACGGITTDLEASIGVDLAFFDDISDVQGHAFVHTIGGDVAHVLGGDFFWIVTLDHQYLAYGFGFSGGVGLSPAEYSFDFCHSFELNEL